MKTIPTLAVALILLLPGAAVPSPARAQGPETDPPAAAADLRAQVDARFADFYYRLPFPDSFRRCADNVAAFIAELRDSKILPADFKTLHLTDADSNWNMENMVISLNCRFSGPDEFGHRIQNFTYHEVGLWQGRIYDFSFDTEPRILPVADYLREMFIPKQPFMPYGQSFRSRIILDPWYEIADAEAEISNFVSVVKPVGAGGSPGPATRYEALADLVRDEACNAGFLPQK